MPGIDRARTFIAAPLLHLLPPLSAYDFFFVRAVRSYLTTAKSCALLHLVERLAEHVAARVALRTVCACGCNRCVAAASEQRSCPRVRLYVRLRAVLAATEAECIGYRSPVDVR